MTVDGMRLLLVTADDQEMQIREIMDTASLWAVLDVLCTRAWRATYAVERVNASEWIDLGGES